MLANIDCLSDDKSKLPAPVIARAGQKRKRGDALVECDFEVRTSAACGVPLPLLCHRSVDYQAELFHTFQGSFKLQGGSWYSETFEIDA